MATNLTSKVLVELEAMVRDSLAPSDDFTWTVPVVDHSELGAKMKAYRKSRKVRAVLVAEKMGIDKVVIANLEFGRKHWTFELMKQYAGAVLALMKK